MTLARVSTSPIAIRDWSNNLPERYRALGCFESTGAAQVLAVSLFPDEASKGRGEFRGEFPRTRCHFPISEQTRRCPEQRISSTTCSVCQHCLTPMGFRGSASSERRLPVKNFRCRTCQ